jgi:hypothetical protein
MANHLDAPGLQWFIDTYTPFIERNAARLRSAERDHVADDIVSGLRWQLRTYAQTLAEVIIQRDKVMGLPVDKKLAHMAAYQAARSAENDALTACDRAKDSTEKSKLAAKAAEIVRSVDGIIVSLALDADFEPQGTVQ